MKLERTISRSHLFAFLAILCWSTIELSSKLLGSGVSPFTITAWRFLIGGLVILPFALRSKAGERHSLKTADLLQMALLGVLNVCLSMLLLQLSIYFGKASVSAVLVSSNPLFVSLFAWLLIRERLSFVQILGLSVALAGIALLVFGEADLATAKYLNLPLSIAFGLGASLTFGLYTVLTKKIIQTHGNLLTNSVAFLSGSVALFLFNIASGKPLLFTASLKNLGIMLWLGIIISGVAYLLFFEAMKKLGAHRTSMYFFLKPVLASLLAVLILGETLSGLQVRAIVVIISGLVFSRIRVS